MKKKIVLNNYRVFDKSLSNCPSCYLYYLTKSVIALIDFYICWSVLSKMSEFKRTHINFNPIIAMKDDRPAKEK